MTEPQPGDTFDDELDLEAPEADLLEQRTAARQEDPVRRRSETPLESDAADAADQDTVAESDDEDDYR